MSQTLLARQVRQMCRGFGSVAVSAAGGSFRGLLEDVEVPQSTGYDGQMRLVPRRMLTIPTEDVTTYDLTVDTEVTIEDETYQLRDLRRQMDGLVTTAILATGARRAA